MFKHIKNILRIMFPWSYVIFELPNLIFNEKSYVYKSGLAHSYKENKPVDEDGSPLPWMNYSVIRFFEERLHQGINMFEYGSGFSTFFYMDKVGKITSLEYDRKWYERIKPKLADNAEIIYQEKDVDGEYCRAIHKSGGKYNMIIVDGRDRVNCVKQALEHAEDDAVIVLDDSQRQRYSEAFDIMKGAGYKVLNFEGLKPTDFGYNRTSLFYKEPNSLEI